MQKLTNKPIFARYIITLSLMFLASTSWASADDLSESNETLSQENAEEECYCSIRKRQQVERRLEKQNQKALEQE